MDVTPDATRRRHLATIVLIAIAGAAPTIIKADIVWHWANNTGYEGTLTTDGQIPVSSGIYQVIDFAITTTADTANFPLGSVGGGQYIEGSVLLGNPTAAAEFTWDATTMEVVDWGTVADEFSPGVAEFYGAIDNNDRILFGANDVGPILSEMVLYPNNVVSSLARPHVLTPDNCAETGEVVWEYSLASGYAGTLTTQGCLPVATGLYRVTDFEITETADPSNFPLGSVSEGTYIEGSVVLGAPMAPAHFFWDDETLLPADWGTVGDEFVAGIAEFYNASDDQDRIIFGGDDETLALDKMTLYPNNIPSGLDGQHNLTPRTAPMPVSTMSLPWLVALSAGILATSMRMRAAVPS